MGNYTSPVRSIPGNPLGGILRANARAARNATGRPVAGPEGPEGPAGEDGATGAAGAPGTTVVTQRLVTGVGGAFTWTFATPYVAAPVVVATAEHLTANVLVTLTSVTATDASGVAWDVVGATPLAGVTVALIAV